MSEYKREAGAHAPASLFIIFKLYIKIFIFALDFTHAIYYNIYILLFVAAWGDRKECMAMNRHDAREAVFTLLFETEFRGNETSEDIFAISTQNREIEADEYVKAAYFGVLEHLEEIDDMINRHANGWKTNRISKVSRSILRLATYEMLYLAEIPASVSINEGVELCKTFDEEKAKGFVNGVLNAIKDEIEGKENG